MSLLFRNTVVSIGSSGRECPARMLGRTHRYVRRSLPASSTSSCPKNLCKELLIPSTSHPPISPIHLAPSISLRPCQTRFSSFLISLGSSEPSDFPHPRERETEGKDAIMQPALAPRMSASNQMPLPQVCSHSKLPSWPLLRLFILPMAFTPPLQPFH